MSHPPWEVPRLSAHKTPTPDGSIGEEVRACLSVRLRVCVSVRVKNDRQRPSVPENRSGSSRDSVRTYPGEGGISHCRSPLSTGFGQTKNRTGGHDPSTTPPRVRTRLAQVPVTTGRGSTRPFRGRSSPRNHLLPLKCDRGPPTGHEVDPVPIQPGHPGVGRSRVVPPVPGRSERCVRVRSPRRPRLLRPNRSLHQDTPPRIWPESLTGHTHRYDRNL